MKRQKLHFYHFGAGGDGGCEGNGLQFNDRTSLCLGHHRNHLQNHNIVGVWGGVNIMSFFSHHQPFSNMVLIQYLELFCFLWYHQAPHNIVMVILRFIL